MTPHAKAASHFAFAWTNFIDVPPVCLFLRGKRRTLSEGGSAQ
jgi:hypothetical protein